MVMGTIGRGGGDSDGADGTRHGYQCHPVQILSMMRFGAGRANVAGVAMIDAGSLRLHCARPAGMVTAMEIEVVMEIEMGAVMEIEMGAVMKMGMGMG